MSGGVPGNPEATADPWSTKAVDSRSGSGSRSRGQPRARPPGWRWWSRSRRRARRRRVRRFGGWCAGRSIQRWPQRAAAQPCLVPIAKIIINIGGLTYRASTRGIGSDEDTVTAGVSAVRVVSMLVSAAERCGRIVQGLVRSEAVDSDTQVSTAVRLNLGWLGTSKHA